MQSGSRECPRLHEDWRRYATTRDAGSCDDDDVMEALRAQSLDEIGKGTLGSDKMLE